MLGYYAPQQAYYQPSYYAGPSYSDYEEEQYRRYLLRQELERRQEQAQRREAYRQLVAQRQRQDQYERVLAQRQHEEQLYAQQERQRRLKAAQRQAPPRGLRQSGWFAPLVYPGQVYDMPSDDDEDDYTSPVNVVDTPRAMTVEPDIDLSAASLHAEPVRQSSTPPPTDAKVEEAVRTLQKHFRKHARTKYHLEQLNSLRVQLQALTKAFIAPERIDFAADAEDESMPKLLYTSNNASLHAHEDALVRLLTQLDGVSSDGSDRVKQERKKLVKDVDRELARLDSLKAEAWKRQNV
ncbi:uncharacterized protein L969DRAFT_94088 [Mixia osmundae IAM 14324]|uniref:BAG domain-containing protein n=1 Tax=Mixia osmundae (strain CBS 9802 / IAM 14324 / JCM 22182 / KY 12970) TaxID=764103 RepID=G7E920_MIXOS|nr:uncharacterized protein L969DRAFT_94088 [Mixia osmundae IAM 14324]KEI40274.1 hypothetical protein L969DRAFT_94088 [Mixia osmundae IAM 14324]GAA99638.1 hypothetical protein E5Q_06339 [Mixia osmundae IAM 14324]